MPETEPERLIYEVDEQNSRITSIRGVEMPDGVLHTPVHLAHETRRLSSLAVEMVNGIFDWADDSRSRD